MSSLSLPPDGLLVRVEASGVNRADLLQRDGDYLPPAGESSVPGLELAGVVERVGGDVRAFSPGDRVCALVGSGAHAGTCVVREPLTLPVPVGMTSAEAAALPEGLATAWWNLVHLGRLTPGETVLVYGANSGVGHLIAQCARALGARVVGGVRGSRWNEALVALGVEPVDTTSPDAAEIVDAIAPGGVDVVVDLVGAVNAPLTARVLGPRGRWLIVGLLGGTEVTLSLRDVIRRRWIVTGSSIRSLGPDEKRQAMAGVRDDLWPLVTEGRIAARIHRTVPRERAEDAWTLMERGGTFGKIVLSGEAHD